MYQRLFKHLVVAACLSIFGLGQFTCLAQTIGTTGDVDPLYNGTDNPWYVGGVLRVGDDANGALAIDDGAIVTNTFAYVGNDGGALGSVMLTNGSAWSTNNILYAGFSGSGTIEIASNSVVSNDDAYLGYLLGSSGTMLVNNGQWNSRGSIYVGRLGDGVLTVNSGGQVTAEYGFIGTFAGEGNTNISGAGSSLTLTNDLFVGVETTGGLTIGPGGTVSNTQGVIGQTAFGSGVVTVTGANANWNNSGDLFVGKEGSGSLNVFNGGRVSAPAVVVGELAGSDGAITVSGAGSELAIDGYLNVGYFGQGSLVIESGGRVTGSTGNTIGNVFSGAARVSGTNSVWTTTGSILVGNASDGQLDILDGGKVVADEGVYAGRFVDGTYTGVGTINVSGAGSTLESLSHLQVGLLSRGVMNVSDQAYVFVKENFLILDGEVNVTGGGQIRVDSTPYYLLYTTEVSNGGKLTVSGAGSSLIGETGKIEIGRRGLGELRVDSGGYVEGSLSIGNNDILTTPHTNEEGTGTMTVTGPGTRVIGSIGLKNYSSLLINGGAALIGDGQISTHSTATVTGDGSSWDTDTDFLVGRSTQGSLIIESGGSVISDRVTLAYTGIGNATISDHSTWSISERIIFGGTVTSGQGGAGILTIEDSAQVTVDGFVKLWGESQIILTGGLLDATTIDIGAEASISFGAGALRADYIIGDFVQDGGQFSPGNSPGLTDIAGDYELTAGTLLMEIAGLTRGTEFDAIDLSGSAVLSGTIDIDLLGGISLVEGDSFLLIDGPSISGTPTFDFTDAALSPGLEWDTSDFLVNGTINVQAVPEPSTLAYSVLLLGLSMRSRRRNRQVRS